MPTEANFIYIIMDRDSRAVYEALLKQGVIVRPMGPKEIRVTIGLPEENKKFIKAMRRVMATLATAKKSVLPRIS